ncbi:MAG: DNA topoisomerase 3, partial [Lachnospirales bacterium]
MKLVIAEKPSVAQAIASVLGIKNRKDGYIEGNDYIITWCVGHLVGLAGTEVYDEKYKKWNKKDLPIIPTNFQYSPSKDKEKQLKLIGTLINRKDVECVINGCDAGREGELIFRLVYNYAKSNKPIKRLWISSMEDNSIKDGFDNLKDGKDFELLYQSALCRSQADWIVGINSTRLFSLLYNDRLNVGRVMSPTLAMIVERNANIKAFQSVPFYNAVIENDNFVFTSEKIEDKEKAENILNACKNKTLVIESVENKDKVEKPPKIYDLTTLQRDANRKLGFTASQTLEYTQSLYEKKLVTYPRTDSSFITDNMTNIIPLITGISATKLGFEVTNYHVEQIVNNSKVTDHHGIIPTKSLEDYNIENLPQGEKAVLTLIMLRLLCSISDSFKCLETVVIAKCDENTFTCKGRTIVNKGFKKYLQNDDEDEPVKSLPTITQGEIIKDFNISIKEGKTTLPKQFTEDTILSAMENAGKVEEIDNEFSGIGTPATRASIIEKLIAINLLERKGDKKTKYLIPTDKGNALITILPENIASPITTTMWEKKLKDIELDKLSSIEFMNEISQMIENLVSTYEVVKNSEVLFSNSNSNNNSKNVIGKCPRCSENVVDNFKTYSCVNKDCEFVIWKDNKFFKAIKKDLTLKMVIELLEKGSTKLTGCHSAKTGK